MSTGGGRNLSLSSKKAAKHRNPSSPARKYFGPYKNMLEEIINASDVEFSQKLVHDTLNPNIWNPDSTIKKEVRLKLLKIAKTFHEFLKADFKIKDVIFTGSMANYNWTAKSDVDLHLILDINGSEEEVAFIDEFLMTKKTIWNFVHDIRIKDHEVEVYAKDKEAELSNKGIFSLARNKWVSEPKKESPVVDAIAVKEKAAQLMSTIDAIDSMKNSEKRAEKATLMGEKLGRLRQTGLDDKGEYSIENLAFKVVRNSGYMEKLWNIKVDSFDDEMSIEETLSEAKKKKKKKYELGCLMVELDIPGWKKFKKEIDQEDMYNEEGFGFEPDPHTTVLYGFHGDVSVDEVKEKMKGHGPIKVKLKKASLFENKDFDVLKFDVSSNDLIKLNKKMTEFPHTNDYPDYHPHVTVAYLKPGKGKKYLDKIKENSELVGEKMIYTTPIDNGANKKTHTWKLNQITLKENMQITEPQTPIILGIEKGIEGMTDRKKELLKIFLNFTVDRLDLKEPVELYVHKGRDEYIVTTASYVPSENSNHVKAEGRALVDIMRSAAHEIVHNKQRELKMFSNDNPPPNIGGKIEDQANAVAGVLIKDFTHNYGYDEIYDE